MPAFPGVVASDKLFHWLFQQHAERIQPLVAQRLPRSEGSVFSAPVLNLAAQMAADPGFLPRLNAETGR